MRSFLMSFFKLINLVIIWSIWWWTLITPLSVAMNLFIMVGGLLLIFPLVWLSREFLDRNPTARRVLGTTIFMHSSVGTLLGMAIIRAVTTYRDWPDWALPVPVEIGLFLVLITGAALALTVVNLAIKGFGAPFYIALSQKLAMEWMYAWTRNPMVLAALAFLVSLGIWFQSALFLLWVCFLFAPALLFFVKVFEERELALRFGASYLEYKSKTSMLFPRKPSS